MSLNIQNSYGWHLLEQQHIWLVLWFKIIFSIFKKIDYLTFLKYVYYIGGTTIHTGLRFKFGQEYLPLEPETMSTVRRQFERMMMVIIDEMSLIAADMFYNIHRKFVEILHLRDMFADRAVMLVGDLMQIPPVQNQNHGKISRLVFNEHVKNFSIFSSNFYVTWKLRKQMPFQYNRHESLEPVRCCESENKFQSWRHCLE